MFNSNRLGGSGRPEGHKRFIVPRQHSRLGNRNRPLEKKTHIVAHPALIPPGNGKNYHSLLPLEIKLIIGEYLDLSSFNAFFATSAEYHKNIDLAELLQKKTLWKFALKMALKSRLSNSKLDNIIKTQIQHNDMLQAERTLFLINPEKCIFHRHLERIIIANAQQGNIATAEKQLSLLENNTPESIRALTAISKAKAKIGDIDGAKEGFSTVKNTVLSMSASGRDFLIGLLNTIALAETESGSAEEAEKTFIAAEKLASQEENDESRIHYLTDIARALIQAGDKEKAKKNLLLARAGTLQFENWSLIGLELEKITEVQIEAGDVSSAKETVDTIKHFEYKSLALKKVALAELKDDNAGAKKTLILAHSTALKIHDIHSRFKSLLDIATTQVTASDVDGAKKTLTSAHLVIREGKKRETLFSIAKIHAATGDMEKVERLFSTVMEQDALVNNFVTLETLMQIAQVQIEIGNMLGAKQTLLTMMDQALLESTHIMPQILQKLAIVEAQMGDIEEAKKNLLSAKKMFFSLLEKKVRVKSSILSKIAEMQAKIGDMQGAKETLSDINKIRMFHRGVDAALKVLATLK